MMRDNMPNELIATLCSTYAHLWWAERLVEHVAPENNAYVFGDPRVTWLGVAGAAGYSNRSVCNTFVCAVLRQAYGWTDDVFRRWFDVRRPSAARFVGAIKRGSGFVQRRVVDHITPGDIMAIRYPAGSTSSGHVVIVRSAAVRRESTAPVIAGTIQYDISVVDSTRSPHGVVSAADTRIASDGTLHPGAGFGIMRLYADDSGIIVGHAWSRARGAPYRPEPEYSVAVGQLVVSRVVRALEHTT
jgi:hypothetical protein